MQCFKPGPLSGDAGHRHAAWREGACSLHHALRGKLVKPPTQRLTHSRLPFHALPHPGELNRGRFTIVRGTLAIVEMLLLLVSERCTSGDDVGLDGLAAARPKPVATHR